MPIPEDFSETEHLQSLVRRYVNKLVRQDFKDLGGDDWDPDVTTTRGAMRHALTHEDNDPITTTLLRLFIYYFIYNKAKSLQADIFGIPASSFDEIRKYKPQITLYFSQDTDDVEDGENKVEGEISFRLMDESSTSLTQAEINSYALKIKNDFAVPGKLVWSKGRLMVSYSDWSKGYSLQLLVSSKVEGKNLIQKVLSIQNHTPDWRYMAVKENEEPQDAYPNNPGLQTILGETYKKPRRRPVEQVKFRYATLAVQGKKRPINLVDTTYRRANAVERV